MNEFIEEKVQILSEDFDLNDKGEEQLKESLKDIYIKAITDAKGCVPELAESATGYSSKFNYHKEWYLGFNKCIEETLSNLDKLTKQI